MNPEPLNPLTTFASLSDILSLRARVNSDSPFLAYENKVWSYSEFDRLVETIARNLKQYGFHPGHRVATFQQRRPEMIAAFLAVSRAGGLPTPINFQLKEPKLSELLSIIHPQWVISDGEFLSLLECHAQVLPPRSNWILSDLPNTIDVPWSAFLKPAPCADFPDHAPDGISYIHFTSGSSGRPKGVLSTHENIWANTNSAIQALNLCPEDCHLNLFAAFAHPHEIIARALHLGGKVVLVDTLKPNTIAAAARLHEVTCVMAVPSVYEIVFKSLLDDPRLDTIRLFEAGGEMTQQKLIDQFRAKRGVAITPVWGSTETSGIAFAAPREAERPTASVGLLCPGFEARIVDEAGKETETGQPGSLLLKSKAVMRAYLDNVKESEDVLRDGWYSTGDIFSTDSAGFFYFLGRTDEMFKIRGNKVYPFEVEQVLLSHPGVAKAAVVGRQTANRGLQPVAFIVLKPGHVLSPEELRAFCRKQLTSFKVPRRIFFRDSLPTTGSGKVVKRLLVVT